MNLPSSGTEESPFETKIDDIFGPTGNGSLRLLVSGSSDWENADSRGLNVGVWTGDFDAIYASALRSKGIRPVDTSGQYDWEKYEANRLRFASEFPQFPIIVGFEDMYKDYVFGSGEIKDLLDECRALRQMTSAADADLSLRRLICGCEEALKENAYLIFVCD